MAGNGGRRLGAGRKKGQSTIASERLRAKLIAAVEKEFPDIKTALFDSAKGHYILRRIGNNPKERVYRKSPTPEAMRIVIEQTMGRPMQPVDMQHSGAISVTIKKYTKDGAH